MYYILIVLSVSVVKHPQTHLLKRRSVFRQSSHMHAVAGRETPWILVHLCCRGQSKRSKKVNVPKLKNCGQILMTVAFEPTPFRTGAYIQRLGTEIPTAVKKQAQAYGTRPEPGRAVRRRYHPDGPGSLVTRPIREKQAGRTETN